MYSEHKICGGSARCIAMLEAFKKVIQDYQTPPNLIISRHLPQHLSHQITYLVHMRPMSVGMGNAVRYIKYEISILPIEWPEEKAKRHLLQRIDAFILERISRADDEIIELANERIEDGDVLLTFGKSWVVECLIKAAKEKGKQFRVIIVDSRPMLEGSI